MTDPRLLVLLGVAGALFATGLAGLIARSNLIKIVISLELLGKGVSLVFVTAGYISPNADVGTSQAVVFTLIIIEAVVAAVALALVILAKRTWKTLDIATIAGKIRKGVE